MRLKKRNSNKILIDAACFDVGPAIESRFLQILQKFLRKIESFKNSHMPKLTLSNLRGKLTHPINYQRIKNCSLCLPNIAALFIIHWK